MFVLETLVLGLEDHLMMTEIYSIHGFSHIFFGIGLASLILLLRPRSAARIVILAVLVAGIAWELHEGSYLRGEPIDSLEDVMLAILSALNVSMLHTKERKRARPVIWPLGASALDKIIDEYTRYMRETDSGICNL